MYLGWELERSKLENPGQWAPSIISYLGIEQRPRLTQYLVVVLKDHGFLSLPMILVHTKVDLIQNLEHLIQPNIV
jgi:hypothetical protein